MAKGIPCVAALLTALATSGCLPAETGANLILHPWRRPLTESPSLEHQDVAFRNDDVLARDEVWQTIAQWIEGLPR